MLNLLVVALLASQAPSSEGLFFASKVCYDGLGCFAKDGFGNTLGELPDSPAEVKVTLTLFTRRSDKNGEVIDYTNPASITGSLFDPTQGTKILIHGYLANGDEPWVTNSTKYFLQFDNFNVIAVDWRAGAKHFYPKSAANTRVVGAIIAKVLTIARDKMAANMSDVHLIGHSLGAHVSGYVGSRVKGIGRITGLDPAGPLFQGDDPRVRLDPTDALFVDCIHTNGAPIYDAGFGTLEAMGHSDFYPNGGQDQAGCPAAIKDGIEELLEFHVTEMTDTVACSHMRSHDLWVASLASPGCNFTSYPCSSYKEFTNGDCRMCGARGCPDMGYYADCSSSRGKFYLKTGPSFPFCGK